ncbi:MAG: RNA 2',3'-cyclic phosphodiesterase [Candidatus Aenigmarchaeota archaeon]|nr:RNA 2',3'-cyclic phosphodiesterase [Candidatus Aenigmarchaeota archaeon]
MRCFVAAEIDEELRKKIAILQKQLSGLDVKLVEPRNLHFTLKFLGDAEESVISEVSAKLKETAANFKPFDAVIKTVGVFPGLNYMRVIWLGCEEIFGLQQSVEDALSSISKKEKPSPHLTIARVRSPKDKDKLIAFVEKNKAIEIGSFVVDKIKLKKSTLTPKGPVYEDIEVFELRG